MPRASRAQAATNRGRVVDAAADMLRERGPDRVSVPDMMAAAGLTHGGFYKQFASKDALLGEACTAAFDERWAYVDSLSPSPVRRGPTGEGNDTDDGGADEAERATVRRGYLLHYLSTAHRDAPGAGRCPVVALAADVARAEEGSELSRAYLEGLHELVDLLQRLQPPQNPTDARQQALVELAMIAGAVTVARASAGDPLSDALLEAVRERLFPVEAPVPGAGEG